MQSFYSSKTAVITGAGSGIGKALAEHLAKMNCNLALCDIDENTLRNTCEEIKTAYPTIKIYSKVFDVRSFEAFESFRDAVLANFETVELVINNAGITVIDSADSSNVVEMKRVMDINYFGSVHGSVLFLPHLKKRKRAHLVNMSSIFGFAPFPTQSAYSASKHAVKAYTECLSMENSDMKGLYFHAVHPSGVKTNILTKGKMIDFSSAFNSENSLRTSFNTITENTADRAALIILKGVYKKRFKIKIGKFGRIISATQRIIPTHFMKLFNLWLKL